MVYLSRDSLLLLPETLGKIKAVLNRQGPVILQHKFYRAARGLETFAFDDFEIFSAYVKANAKPGDKLNIWSFSDVCGSHNALATSKFPDSLGRTPKLGAY